MINVLLKFREVAEKLFIVLALLIFTEPLIGQVHEKMGQFRLDDPSQADPLLRAVRWGTYAIILLLLIPQWQKAIDVAARDKLLWVLIGISLASAAWSELPKLTLRHSIGLGATTLFGTYLAARYSLKEQLQLLAWMLGLSALLSLVFATAVPAYGLHEDGWRGIYWNQNNLGRWMCLSAIIFLILALSSRRHRWVFWAGFGLSAALIWTSTSQTALIVFVAILALLPASKALQRYSPVPFPWLIAAGILGCGIIWWVIGNMDIVTSLLGKDVTLSLRTSLWEAVLVKIRERPWLGYGYGAFWPAVGIKDAHILPILGPNVAGKSHNGFLDLWLDLGLFGVLAFALQFLRKLPQVIACIRSRQTPEEFWPMTCMTFTVLYNITESTLLTQHSIFWVIYVATILSMSPAASQPAEPEKEEKSNV
ncbi:O-antigen ligase family protein [Kamptonema formosum]|uniref:O-antigen ligase family protein n=1 Tax=Kamptonema formosum TaxID=331992 RepID=UPI0003497782|nr:O-antigen ligase [Oscillatoria sp. PCC 10802]